jgi:hypothetical protein
MTGVVCCLAQVGSFDMSIGFIFGGVPVYVTLPEIDAFPAGAGNPAIPPFPTSAAPARSISSFFVIE